MKLAIIESPYDCGIRNRRMGAGPTHLIQSGLVDDLTCAGHEVELTVLDLGPGLHPEIGAAAELARRIGSATAEAVKAGRFPIVLSGNCNAAIGSVAGIGPRGTAVLWFDAHGDLNTPETSVSGFFDGMGYAMLLGHGWEALAKTIPGFEPLSGSLAAIVAARDLDPPEVRHIEAWGMKSFAVEGLRTGTDLEALEGFAASAQRLYVHVDLDALDPTVLLANHLAVEDGVTVSELSTAIAAASRKAPIAGIGFASYAPESDRKNAGPRIVKEILGGLLKDLERHRPMSRGRER